MNIADVIKLSQAEMAEAESLQESARQRIAKALSPLKGKLVFLELKGREGCVQGLIGNEWTNIAHSRYWNSRLSGFSIDQCRVFLQFEPPGGEETCSLVRIAFTSLVSGYTYADDSMEKLLVRLATGASDGAPLTEDGIYAVIVREDLMGPKPPPTPLTAS